MRNNSFQLGLWLAVAVAAAAQQRDFDARDMFYSAAEMMPAKKPAESGQKRPGPKGKPAASGGGAQAPQGPVSRPQPELAANTPVPQNPELHFAAMKGTMLLGLRYSILQKTPAGLVEVRPGREFHAGDSIRVSVMGNQKGYLYIVARGSSGLWTPLFPHPESTQRSNDIVPGRKYQVPDGTGEFYTFDERGGEEHLFLLLSKTPVTDLDEVIRSLADRPDPKPAAKPAQPLRVMEATNRLNDAFIDRLRNGVQSRDLVFTRTDDTPAREQESSKEDAVYVINTGAANLTDARVVVDVKLIHR